MSQSYSKELGYNVLDPFKRLAIEAALTTTANNRFFKEEPTSRGQSAYVAWLRSDPDTGICTVIEGLGTKNIVAQAMYELTGDPRGFAVVSKDTIAMIVNDLITIGCLPALISMHFAVGDKKWMEDARRIEAVISGWKEGCDLSGAIWAGGETPALKGIVSPEYPEMSGSAMGIISRKHYMCGDRIQDGDQILVFTSSGIHANGLTAAREVAHMLPEGYLTPVGSATYGDALLQPTVNYVKLIAGLQKANVDLHYAVNITGHGWRKLMRADGSFEYRVHALPKAQELFSVIQSSKQYTDWDMYSDFNMGAGFAVYVPVEEVATVLSTADRLGYAGYQAGYIKSAREKCVLLEPLDIRFDADELSLK